MRSTLSLFSPFVTAALVAAALPAAAQQAATPAYVRPALHRAATFDAPVVRTVAVYEFIAPRNAGIPTLVTVADSAGQLVATFMLPGAATARPMMVEVLNTDLVLQGETPSGPITLLLHQKDVEPVGAVIGRWLLGDMEGKLRAAR